MKTKTLIITLSLCLLTLGGGGAAAWWWYMNQPEQLEAQAKQYLAENRGSKAAELLTRLANSGNQEAMQQLATLYAEGKLVPQDETKAAQYYLKLAEQGNKNAQQEMATRFEQGLGVQKDIAQAGQWLEILANGGDEAALRKLCALYLSGALQDATKAFQLYQAMAEKMPEAKRALADCYADGKGMEKNPAEAAKIYEQILPADDADGQYKLACCYMSVGDEEKASFYTKRAAELGNIEACIKEGCRLYDNKNYNKAFPYLKIAADAGDAKSAARLSLCYQFALGTQRNAEEADKWGQMAKNKGEDPSSYPNPVSILVKTGGKIDFPTQEETEMLLRLQYAAPLHGKQPLAQNLYGGLNIELPNQLYNQFKNIHAKLRDKMHPRSYVQLLLAELEWWKHYRNGMETNIDQAGRFITTGNPEDDKLHTIGGLQKRLELILENPDNVSLFPHTRILPTPKVGLIYNESPENAPEQFHYGDENVIISTYAHGFNTTSALPYCSFWDTKTGKLIQRTQHSDNYVYPVRNKDNTYAMYGFGYDVYPNGVWSPLTNEWKFPRQYNPEIKELLEKYRYGSIEEAYFDKMLSACEGFEWNLKFERAEEDEGILTPSRHHLFLLNHSIDNQLVMLNTKQSLYTLHLGQLKSAPLHVKLPENIYDTEEGESILESIFSAANATAYQERQNFMKRQEKTVQQSIKAPIGFYLNVSYYVEQGVPMQMDYWTYSRGSEDVILFVASNSQYDTIQNYEETSVGGAHYLGIYHEGTLRFLTVPDGTKYIGEKLDGFHHELKGTAKLMTLQEVQQMNDRSPRLLRWSHGSLKYVQKWGDGENVSLFYGNDAEDAGFIGVHRINVNLKTGDIEYVEHWRSEPGILNFAWLEKPGLLLLPQSDFKYKIIRPHQKRGHDDVGELIVTAQGEYVIALTNGLYAGSPGCERLLNYGDGQHVVSIQTLAPWRNRPAEVLAALGGNPDDITILRETTRRWLRKLGYNPDNMPAEPALDQLPRVAVEIPNLKQESSELSFKVVLQATAHDICDLEVLRDGVRIPQDHIKEDLTCTGTREVMVHVPLATGTNWIEVTPIDTAGVRGETTAFRTLKQGTSNGRLFIVSLGVSEYNDSNLNLQYAAKDAEDIATAFTQQTGDSTRCLVLKNNEVQKDSFTKNIRAFLSETSVNDSVVLYVAGHGVLDEKLEYYYAPADFDNTQVQETGISLEDIMALLNESTAHHRILILDTCHSGILGEEGEEKNG